jgi:hypothetical protein
MRPNLSPIERSWPSTGRSYFGLKNCANSLYICGVNRVFYANKINELAPEKTGCESCRPSQPDPLGAEADGRGGPLAIEGAAGCDQPIGQPPAVFVARDSICYSGLANSHFLGLADAARNGTIAPRTDDDQARPGGSAGAIAWA